MKTFNFVMIPIVIVMTGCAGLQRPLLDGALGAAGGYAGSQLSGGNPAATAGGAVGGILVGEGIHALQRRNQRKAFERGVDQGRGLAAKALYWDLVDQQRSKHSTNQ